MDVITDGKISGKISDLRPKRCRHVAVAAAGEPVIQRTSERSTACHRHRDFLTYLQGIALPFPWNRAYSAGILRPKPCFFWRVESSRIKDLPLLWNDILTTCSQLLYYTKILLLLGIFTGTPPPIGPMLGKTHGENSPKPPKPTDCVSQRGLF